MGKETCRLLAPLGLKVNAQETPLAVEGAVEFQWRLASVSPGAYQSAYRVVLRAESRELLWDSGKVLSARQLQIPYEGRALEPFARYFWRVMVWDVEGNASPWSEEAAFETGPLSAEDWRCGWIACRQRDDPLAGAKWMGVESTPGEAVDFSLDFTAPEDFQQAVFDGTAFARWELYCNGILCRHMNSAWKQDGTSPIRYADLSEYIKPGGNALLFRVWADERGRASAISRFTVRGASGERTYESGRDWRVSGHPAPCVGNYGDAPWGVLQRRGRAPLFRREFTLASAVRRARLYYCGLGYAACAINGAPVDDSVLTTEYSQYGKSVYFNAVDVSGLLREGGNCLAVELGRGYYASGKDWIGEQPEHGEPKLLLLLRIWLADGSVACVGSDGDWRCALGATLDDSVWYGEKFDARLVEDGWDMPGFDDAHWLRAEKASAPRGALRALTKPTNAKIALIK